jgi:hypothetical protein
LLFDRNGLEFGAFSMAEPPRTIAVFLYIKFDMAQFMLYTAYKEPLELILKNLGKR